MFEFLFNQEGRFLTVTGTDGILLFLYLMWKSNGGWHGLHVLTAVKTSNFVEYIGH